MVRWHTARRRASAVVAPSSWRYLLIAALVRVADGGAAVALVTLAVGSVGRVSATDGGLLAALLTAPQLLGPLLARPLARSRHPRRVLALAFAVFGMALAACGVALDRAALLPAAVAAGTAGCVGPLVTGGLSTFSGSIRDSAEAHDSPVGQRRAEALDATTYGIGGTLGPVLTMVLMQWWSPVVAVLALGAAAGSAAVLALTMPVPRGAQTEAAEGASLSLRQVLRAIAQVRALHRVLAATTIAALGTGGVLIVGVVFGAQLTGQPATGALLAGAFGAGNLAGSLALALRPLRTEPEVTTLVLLILTGVLVALTAAAPDPVLAAAGFAMAGAATSAQFAASLGVRSTYAPVGTRTEVYVSMAGLKVGCASLGAAMASGLLGLGPRAALLVVAALIITGPVVALVLRRADGDRMRRKPRRVSTGVECRTRGHG